MKKYINGKVYDTETAKKVGDWDNGYLPGNFDYYRERMFRKKTGEYFLWSCTTFSGQDEIRPLTFDEAREWAEEHLDGDEYEEIFGAISDDGTDCLISAVVKASSRDRLRRAVEKSGKTAGQILDELIEENL